MSVSTEVKTFSFIEAIRSALDDAMALDDRVFLIGEDVADQQEGGVFKTSKGLSKKYGTDRVRSTPISEEGFVGAGVGAALVGLRPVVELMFLPFVALALDQIANHAAKLRYMSGGQHSVPLTIRASSGAGSSVGAHHTEQIEAWLAHTPGLKVVMPSNPADAYGLLLSSIFDDDPCIFIEHSTLMRRGLRSPIPEPNTRIPIGKANVTRTGSDVTIVGYGGQIVDAFAVAEKFAEEGVDVEVVDLRTILPLDMETVLKSVAKTRRAVVVHEATREFGVGAEVASRIYEELFGELAAPIERLGSPFTPVPASKVLESAFIPGPVQIESAVRRTLL